MGILYIANVTKQNFEFHYRIPENRKLHRRHIPAGTQTDLNFAPEVLASIIDQHVRHGMIPLEDLEKGKTFSGLVYRLDKPLNVEHIQRGIQYNDKMRFDESDQIRKDAAVAVHHSLSEQARERGNRLNELEMGFEEVSRGPADANAGQNRQTVTVKSEGETPSRRRKR